MAKRHVSKLNILYTNSSVCRCFFVVVIAFAVLSLFPFFFVFFFELLYVCVTLAVCSILSFQRHLLWRRCVMGEPTGTGQHGNPNDKTFEYSSMLSQYWCHFKRFGGRFSQLSRWRWQTHWLPNTNWYASLFLFSFFLNIFIYFNLCTSITVFTSFPPKHPGILIPNDVEKLSQFRSKAFHILVVEKDSTFQKLIDDKIERFIGDCILITVRNFYI